MSCLNRLFVPVVADRLLRSPFLRSLDVECLVIDGLLLTLVRQIEHFGLDVNGLYGVFC